MSSTKATRISTAYPALTPPFPSSSSTSRARRVARSYPRDTPVDVIDGVRVTCIDNGMPVVCLRAAEVGLTGNETPAEIEANASACAKVEAIRLAAGEAMNLGDVTTKTVPKVSLLSPPTARRRPVDANIHPQAGPRSDRRIRAPSRSPPPASSRVRSPTTSLI